MKIHMFNLLAGREKGVIVVIRKKINKVNNCVCVCRKKKAT